MRLLPGVVRIADVLPESPADQTGLERGDLLLGVIVKGRFGDQELPITSLIDLARLLEQNRGNKMRVIILRGERDLVGTLQVAGTDKR